ncbi:16S rRNA (cytidine(1402)-2'-O)-methyltransferase [Candidatus Kaiserbacteria bacterium]|nr:16S rRNA (cytidine(1402)-2'-O)-methyltransferase [Candidatus Kaiserbacteria bacterium]
MEAGKLSIVATPIGNMGDITFRALWNLKECTAIYAEDTREILKLLNHYGLRKSVFRLDAATEEKKAKEVAERLERGEHIVYVTDAGTPGISDPGARLVQSVRRSCEALREAGQQPYIIDAIPGASALTAALSIAGIDASEFLFLGFPPHKKGRQTFVSRIAESNVPVVLYESPHRILKLLGEIAKVAPKSRVIIGRELTKIHEEVLSGTPHEVTQALEEKKAVRGEFVVIVEAASSRRRA